MATKRDGAAGFFDRSKCVLSEAEREKVISMKGPISVTVLRGRKYVYCPKKGYAEVYYVNIDGSLSRPVVVSIGQKKVEALRLFLAKARRPGGWKGWTGQWDSKLQAVTFYLAPRARNKHLVDLAMGWSSGFIIAS